MSDKAECEASVGKEDGKACDYDLEGMSQRTQGSHLTHSGGTQAAQPLQLTRPPAALQNFSLAVLFLVLILVIVFILFSRVAQLPQLPQLIFLLRGLVLTQVADGLQVRLGDALHGWHRGTGKAGSARPEKQPLELERHVAQAPASFHGPGAELTSSLISFKSEVFRSACCGPNQAKAAGGRLLIIFGS